MGHHRPPPLPSPQSHIRPMAIRQLLDRLKATSVEREGPATMRTGSRAGLLWQEYARRAEAAMVRRSSAVR